MKKSKWLALLLTGVVGASLASGALAETKPTKSADVVKKTDVLRVTPWANTSGMTFTLDGTGMKVNTLAADTSVELAPTGITIDFTKWKYLAFKISDFPSGKKWNWEITYRDSGGRTGVVAADVAYNPTGYSGSADIAFDLGTYFSQQLAATPTLKIDNITITKIKFTSGAPAGTTFTINEFFIGTGANDPVTSVSPSTSQSPTASRSASVSPSGSNPKNGDSTPFYLGIFALAALVAGGAIFMPKFMKNGR